MEMVVVPVETSAAVMTIVVIQVKTAAQMEAVVMLMKHVVGPAVVLQA